LFIFVIIELTLALDHLDVFGVVLAAQRVETARFGLLLLTELMSPTSGHVSGADDDHFRVGGDGVLRNDVLQFVLSFLGDVTVDLLTALLRLMLEVAFFHLSIEANVDGLDELLLGAVALVDDDGGRGFDLSVLASSGLLSPGVLAMESLIQSGVGLAVLLAGQCGANDAADLAVGIALGTMGDGGQSQLDSGWGNDRIFIIVFLFGLLVQFGCQMRIGLFQFLEQMVFRCATMALLLSAGLVLITTSLMMTALVLVLLAIIIVILAFVAIVFDVMAIQTGIAFLIVSVALLALLIIVIFIRFVLIVIVAVVAIDIVDQIASLIAVALLMLQITDQTIEAIAAGVGGAGHSQAKSDQNEETHCVCDSSSKI
jgi:hypothetical protein